MPNRDRLVSTEKLSPYTDGEFQAVKIAGQGFESSSPEAEPTPFTLRQSAGFDKNDVKIRKKQSPRWESLIPFCNQHQ